MNLYTALWAMSTAAASAGCVIWLRRCYLVIAVVGGSMEPTLRHGDRVLARRARREPRRGSIVVLRTASVAPTGGPASDLPDLLVKRVVAVAHDPMPDRPGTVPPGRVYVRGDAPRSYDSRDWGPAPVEAVVARVVRVLTARNPRPAANGGQDGERRRPTTTDARLGRRPTTPGPGAQFGSPPTGG